MSYIEQSNNSYQIKFTNTILIGCILIAIFIPGHMFNWLPERIFGITLAIIAITFVSLNGTNKHIWGVPIREVFFLFLCLQIIFILGYLYSISFAHRSTGVRDYVNLYKYVIQFFIILFISFSFKSIPLAIFDRVLKLSLWFSLFVFICYLIEIPVLSSLFQNVIYADAKMRFGEGLFRTTAPFENPNYLGFYLLMTLNYFIFFSTSKHKAIYSILCVGLIFATGSRSAWICTLIVSIFYYILHCISVKNREKSDQGFKGRLGVIMFLPTAILGMVIIFWDQILKVRRLLELIEALGDGGIGKVSTASARFDAYSNLTTAFLESPIFGNGTYKYTLFQVIDNQLFSWLFSIGAIGTIILLIFYSMIFMVQLKTSRNKCHLVGVISFWGSLFAMLQTGAFLDNVRLYFLFIFFISIIHASLTNFSQKTDKGIS